MAIREMEPGKSIYVSGQKTDCLYLVTRGLVEAKFDGGSYMLHTGDVIGLCEIDSGIGFLEYKAIIKSALTEYPYDCGNMPSVFGGNEEVVKQCLSSMFKQITTMLGQQRHLKEECTALYEYLISCTSEYGKICEKYQLASEEAAEFQEMAAFCPQKTIPAWLSGYYATLEQMMSIWDHNKTDTDFVCGFLSRAAKDMRDIAGLCKEMQDYKQQICRMLLCEDGPDVFGMYTAAYYQLMKRQNPEKEAASVLKVSCKDMLSQLESQGYGKQEFYICRKQEFEKLIDSCESSFAESVQDEELLRQQRKELSGSLDKILSYAECSKEVDFAFRQNVLKYKKLVNRSSTDEAVRVLRHELTEGFYKVYISALQNSVKQEEVPVLLKMFFNFGYVDEELAGWQNALYLYQMVDRLPTSPKEGVFSFYEWLMAIYRGEKEPGRNEFDMDYAEYLREKKRNGKITQQEEASLLSNQAAKVMYELENVFPLVNKVTYGRISVFCPVFSEHDVLKPLDTALVSAEKIKKVIGAIRKIDYSAYYRQTIYSEPEAGVARELVDVEFLPDFILTPNVGSRGVMWQEIEGKRRTTPARMMCPIFLVEDLTMTLVRLTAEFRWEMCKRVQGGRWNDVSDPSLTSEYFDYVQFYRKNSELSASAKEKIKNDILKARNSFKEMFVRDYLLWVLYESNGAPRLNKVARNILFTYCPFGKEIREKLGANPMYRDIVAHYDSRMGQKRHRMENLCQKLKSQGKDIPGAIEKQREYLEM